MSTVTLPHVTRQGIRTVKATTGGCRPWPVKSECAVPGCGSRFTSHFNLKGTPISATES